MGPDVDSASSGRYATVKATLSPIQRRLIAVLYGGVAHSLFAIGVGLMVIQLHSGLRLGLGLDLGSKSRFLIDALLLLQFPFLHSFLLARRGRYRLLKLAPAAVASDLSTTTFAAVASLQIALAFGLWVPSGIVWWQPRGTAMVGHTVIYAVTWVFLIKALWDAGLGLQTGALGWRAVYRGSKPDFARFPNRGLFKYLRQPVYLGFAFILWTGPVWTPDHLTIALVWTVYCLVGPRLKERRYRRIYGPAFDSYRARVPYMLPAPRRSRRNSAIG